MTSSELVLEYAAESVGLSAAEYRAAVDELRYRRGFLLERSVDGGPARSGWSAERLGAYVLSTHPDTALVVVRGDGVEVALLGEAFDPWQPELRPEGVADVVHQVVRRGEEHLLELLDRLAGRFRVLVVRGEVATAWHDAMGSGAVVYDEAGGTCASHAALLAEHLGRTHRDYVIPFLTTRNYRLRDVKYFPGALSPYDGVLHLTPNTRLDVGSGTVERYWPREALAPVTVDDASRTLEEYLVGQAEWFRSAGRTPLLGVTAGTDSRGLLAAFAEGSPTLFTYVRSEGGRLESNHDSRTAQALAAAVGLSVAVLQVRDVVPLNTTLRPIDVAYRSASGGIRGGNSAWVGAIQRDVEVRPEHLMVRGFGGEVMRGFYQQMPTAMTHLSPNQLARTYDVNAGAAVTRAAFRHLMDTTDMQRAVALGMDPNDVLYWEHRMGVWGSITMLESELATASMPGYNSRRLFSAFLGLDYVTRHSRQVIHDTFRRMRPELMGPEHHL
ncbi:hypothetical protein Q9R32_09565 [Actinotalea sp. AC32]|nr:hypothetical protein [Actinotalea sp. AC32]